MSVLNGNDEIIMLAILALGKNAYGATMMRYLTKITGKEWSIGAIYDPLYRLEKKGYVRSLYSAPTSEKGGRRKRLYQVTEAGLEAIEKQKKIRDELSNGLPDFA